ncbi:MAG: hypothetical protein ACRDRL_29500 [Sciscionella sp.]
MSFLDKITGKYVEATGFIGAASALVWLIATHRTPGEIVCLSLWVLAAALRYLPKVDNWFKFLQGFAEVPAWPEFVVRGLAALAIAHGGGGPAVLVISFMLVAADGRMFDALY